MGDQKYLIFDIFSKFTTLNKDADVLTFTVETDGLFQISKGQILEKQFTCLIESAPRTNLAGVFAPLHPPETSRYLTSYEQLSTLPKRPVLTNEGYVALILGWPAAV